MIDDEDAPAHSGLDHAGRRGLLDADTLLLPGTRTSLDLEFHTAKPAKFQSMRGSQRP